MRLQKLHSQVLSCCQQKNSESLKTHPTQRFSASIFCDREAHISFCLGQRYINQKQIADLRAPVIHTKKKINQKPHTETCNSCDIQCSHRVGILYAVNCSIPTRVSSPMKAAMCLNPSHLLILRGVS